jgi:cytochrome P450
MASTTECNPDADSELVLNPYSWDFHDDPYPVYQRLRQQAPVYYNPELNFYALSRHRDVVNAFKDWQTFSNRAGVALENTTDDINKVYFILAMDPPRHHAVRGIIRKVFTPRRVAQLEPGIRAMSRRYIEQFAADGNIEFIEAFAGRIPMDLISEMIGVPESDRDMIRAWANTLMERVDGSPEVPEAGIEASLNLLGYFGDMVRERQRHGRGNDLTTDVLNAELDGERLSVDDVVSFLFLMSVAGNETTTKLLANMMYWADRNRDEFAKVQANSRRIRDWVEETLRYDNSSQILYRTTTRDVSLHGVTIPADNKVALLVGAANRDGSVFHDADHYNIDRNCKDTLAFGKGVHFCLGAALARLEGHACMDELFKVYRDFSVDHQALVRVHSSNVRGFSQFPITLIKK